MKSVRVLFVLTLAISLTILGCPLHEKEDRTPNGWKVKWKDQGTISSGLHSKDQLYALFDAAMERGIQEVYTGWGVDPNYVRHKLRENDALYTLFDNFYFKTEGQAADVPDAQYASGETFNRLEVWIAFYDRDDPGAVDPSAVDPTSPPWTLKASTTYPGKVYYGMEYDGRQYPATGYELHWQFTTVP